MQEVEFYYPDDLLSAMAKADAAVAKSKAAMRPIRWAMSTRTWRGEELRRSIRPQLNFSYKIDGPEPAV